MEIYEYKDDKEKAKIEKIFYSSLTCRLQKNIYIDNDNPFEIFYTHIHVSELFGYSRTTDESIHLIKSKGYDVRPMHDEKYPLIPFFREKWEKVCLHLPGLEFLKRKYKDDLDGMRKEMLYRDGEYYVLKPEKMGKRTKYVEVPVANEINSRVLMYLHDQILTWTTTVDTADVVHKQLIENHEITGPVTAIPIKHKRFGKRLSIPYRDGFTSISIKEALKHLKIPGVTGVFGCQGPMVTGYFRADSDLCEVISVAPAYFWVVI